MYSIVQCTVYFTEYTTLNSSALYYCTTPAGIRRPGIPRFPPQIQNRQLSKSEEGFLTELWVQNRESQCKIELTLLTPGHAVSRVLAWLLSAVRPVQCTLCCQASTVYTLLSGQYSVHSAVCPVQCTLCCLSSVHCLYSLVHCVYSLLPALAWLPPLTAQLAAAASTAG